MNNDKAKTYLFSNGKNLFIRVCSNQDQLERAQSFFSSECGASVGIIATGPAELAEQCLLDHRNRWYRYGMYGFTPEMLSKFATTSEDYDVAIGKIRGTRFKNKWERFKRKTSSKIQSFINEVAWVLGLKECDEEFDLYDYDEEV